MMTLPKLSRGRVLDRVEQVGALVLFVWLCARLWPQNAAEANWYVLLLLVSEGLVVLLLLIRRPTEGVSMRIDDWAVAAGGTFLALMVSRGGEPLIGPLGGGLLLFGIAVHITAKLSLWRSFGLVPANRGVRDRGLYAFVRHPMYAGYFFSHVGFLLLSPSWWNLGVYFAVWACLLARIFAEERMLMQDPAYAAFAARVPFRLVPGVF